MAVRTLRQCDRCEKLDTIEDRVRRITVAGPKMDLCRPCRVRVLVFMGVEEGQADAYVLAADTRESQQGAQPALEELAPEEAVEVEEEAPEEGEAAPVRGRRGK